MYSLSVRYTSLEMVLPYGHFEINEWCYKVFQISFKPEFTVLHSNVRYLTLFYILKELINVEEEVASPVEGVVHPVKEAHLVVEEAHHAEEEAHLVEEVHLVEEHEVVEHVIIDKSIGNPIEIKVIQEGDTIIVEEGTRFMEDSAKKNIEELSLVSLFTLKFSKLLSILH